MWFKADEPGIYLSAGAHIALLLWGVLFMSQAKPFDDFTESVPVDVISESQFREMTRGSPSEKQVRPDTPVKVDRVARTEEQKDPGEAKKDVPAPPPPPLRPVVKQAEEDRDEEEMLPPPLKTPTVPKLAKAEPPRPVQPVRTPEPPQPQPAKPEPVKAAAPPKPTRVEQEDDEDEKDAEIIRQKQVKQQEAQKAEDARKAEERRKADEAKKAEDAKREAMKRAAEAQAAEDARKAAEAKRIADARAAEAQKQAMLKMAAEQDARDAAAEAARQKAAEAAKAKAAEDARKATEAARKAAEAKAANEARKAAEKAESDKLNASIRNRLLASRETPQSTGSSGAQVTRTASAGAPTASGQKLSPSDREQLMGIIKEQMEKCWSVSVTSAPAVKPVVRLQLGPNGAITASPVLTNSSSDPSFQAVADSGMRAIRQCAPYRIPAKFADKFDDWKTITVRLDPTDLL